MNDQQKGLILGMLAYAAQRDIDPATLCRLSGIDLNALKKGKAVLNGKHWNDLWANACHLSNDPLFGLHFGESLQLAALGAVGEIIKTSSTVGEAVTHAAALTHLVTDLFRMEITQTKQSFTISFIAGAADIKTPSFAFRQMMDLFMVFVVHELDGFLLGKIKPKAVRFSYAIPNLHEYERVLRCRPVKKTGEFSLSFDMKYWNEPILTANYEMQNILLQKVSSLTSQPNDAQTFQSRIYNYLLANAYLGMASLEDIAANFNLSPRSLQRKLKDEGISYQQLAEQVRKSLALHYMDSGKYQFKEISYMLGYNELSAFSRAFKKWTGTAPIHYRKTA